MIRSIISGSSGIETSSPYTSKSISVSAQDSYPVDMAFSSNGTRMYIMGLNNDTVYQYNLSTAWDISTATYATLVMSVSAQDSSPSGLALSSNGTKMFITGLASNTVYQYDL